MTLDVKQAGAAQAADAPEATDDSATRAPAALTVGDLTVRYGSRSVLHDISLQVAPGEVVGLIGESGSGKTTLARTVLGSVPSASGTVKVAGREVSGFSAGQWRRFRRAGHAQYVFQDPLRSLDVRFTALRSVLEGARETFSRSAARQEAERALRAVGLAETLWASRPAELSGGQRQRVAIARALAVQPALLVCDEPVSALDASSRIEVVRTLEAAARAGTGILLISHDLSSLGTIADRVAVLHEGTIVESGTAAEVLGSPRHPYTQRLIAAIPSISDRQPDTIHHPVTEIGDGPVAAGCPTTTHDPAPAHHDDPTTAHHLSEGDSNGRDSRNALIPAGL